MALEGALANIPGLAGYLGVQQFDQQRALGDLQGVMQLAQAVESAQQAPLKAQLMQSQLAEAQRANQERAQVAQRLAEIQSRYGPRSETVTDTLPDDEMTGTPAQQVQRTVQRPMDLAGAAGEMLFTPGLQGVGGNLLNTLEARQGRQEQAQLAAQARLQELQMRLQDAQLSREQRAEAAREMMQLRRDLAAQSSADRMALAQFSVANRPERADPLVQVEVPDPSAPGGKRAIYMPQSQAVGMSPPGPGTTGKALPATAAKSLLENNQNLRRAEQALALISGQNVGGIQGDANATGWKAYAPDSILQRMDPQGIQTRAAIADLGSLVIHDRSGAAVTAAEFPRLRPFIPAATDDPKTVAKKVENFVNVYKTLVNETADFYEASGYNVPRQTLQSSAGTPQLPRIANDTDFAKLPSGTRFVGPDGVTRVKP